MSKSSRSIMFVIVIMSVLLIFGNTVKAANAKQLKLLTGKEKKQATEEVQLPEHLSSDEIDAFLATLSDEQVRRLLIEELKEKAALEAAAKKGEEESSSFADHIRDMRKVASHIRDRIRFLMSGASGVDDYLPEAFGQLMERDRSPNPLRAIVYLFLLFVGALFFEWMFRRYTASARRRLEGTQPTNWRVKVGRLAWRSLLDFASICVLAFATLALFYIFLDDGRPMRLLVLVTYLEALLVVWGVRLLSNLLLSPSADSLRFLPLNDESARYIHKWIIAIAAVGSFGWLTCGLIALQGISEAEHLLLVAMVGLIIALMLVVMIIQKRKSVAEILLRDDLPEHSLRPSMARSWHRLAILYVFAVWAVWAISMLLVGPGVVLAAVVTILIIPIYFFLDWSLHRLLELTTVHYHKDLATVHYHNQATEDTSEVVGNPGTATQENNPDDILRDEPLIEESKVSRHIPLIRRSFRILLAAGFFFLILKLWGIDLPVAIMFTENALAVVLTIVIAIVGWQLAKVYIDRRLQEELPDDDEEIDEGGGKGGTRRGTLLVLLRKFILAVLVVMVSLIVLSALGVNIGPLIAGAGIVGIAIGFGAQTLVKDIISGVFFLIDDAFRVGDYIQAGSMRGTVEHISLRSLRLRHHRGMLITVPFGDMQAVTNYSRDYIIMKLEFRVRYDTNVKKVKKLIKKINKEIQQDEELGPSLLDKIKSQGVREMHDSAMIMRVKFKSVPGEQFILRREVYQRLQLAFRENGIEFAHRNVTVYFPPESSETEAEGQGESETAKPKTPEEKKKEAAAAAAIRAIEEEETPEEKPDKP